jgi:hypothetical protein
VRTRRTYHVEAGLQDRLHAAAVALRGVHVYGPTETTQADIIDHALELELGRLEREHNDGGPFPVRKRTPRGRPRVRDDDGGKRRWRKVG